METIDASPAHWYNKTWLVIILCLFFFPVGLYALWKSSTITKGWKIGGTVVLALLVVAVLNSDPKANTDTSVKEKAEPEPTAATAPAVTETKEIESDAPAATGEILFKNATDFKNAFNAASASNNLGFEIDKLKVQEGDVQNTFTYAFTDNIGLLGTVDKAEGTVKEVMMIGTGDGTFKSGSDIFLCMAAIIATVDPNLQPSERGEIMKDLGLFGDNKKDITNLSGKTQRNGIKYFVTSNKITGVMFGVSHN